MLRVLAVDLGATSVRVAAVDLDGAPPSIDIVHRFTHEPIRAADGSLRWDWERLVGQIRHGLEAGVAGGPVASIGVDCWGVDYGLLDDKGELVAAPYSYRDARTARWAETAERLGRERLYQETGIQLMAPNTVFQLAVHDRDELRRARQLLMLPELIVATLTGQPTGERTSAGTSALVDIRTETWSESLLADIGVDPEIMPAISPPGVPVGRWRGVPVHLVASHDTASAVVALPGPPQPGAAFVSSGTWLLVGAERPAPDISEAARLANFSNEPSAFSGVRFLKNVVGFWMLEQCRAAWGHPPLEELAAAAANEPAGPVVDATDQRFMAASDVEAELRSAARLPGSASRSQVVRCIFDSLATSTAKVIGELNGFLGRSVPEVVVVGGGSRFDLLNRLLEEACQVPVRRGPVEATALGNALVQGIALGRFADLSEARRALAGVESVAM